MCSATTMNLIIDLLETTVNSSVFPFQLCSILTSAYNCVVWNVFAFHDDHVRKYHLTLCHPVVGTLET